MDGRFISIAEFLVPTLPLTDAERRAEAERLIELARALLGRPEEEMAASHLDHAIETLRMLGDGGRSGSG